MYPQIFHILTKVTSFHKKPSFCLVLSRHTSLVVSPYNCLLPPYSHCTPQGEMKMPVCIEDECNSELPPASLLFRAARQYAYGVLFSLAETHRRLERLALRKRAPLEGRATDFMYCGYSHWLQEFRKVRIIFYIHLKYGVGFKRF